MNRGRASLARMFRFGGRVILHERRGEWHWIATARVKSDGPLYGKTECGLKYVQTGGASNVVGDDVLSALCQPTGSQCSACQERFGPWIHVDAVWSEAHERITEAYASRREARRRPASTAGLQA